MGTKHTSFQLLMLKNDAGYVKFDKSIKVLKL